MNEMQNQSHNEKQQEDSNANLHNRNMMHISKFRYILTILLTIILTSFILLAILFVGTKGFTIFTSKQSGQTAKIQQVYNMLDRNYYKNFDNDKVIDQSIKGMVKGLDDPYSEYMTKKETEKFTEDVSGDFVGIGAEMQKKHDELMVTSPIKGSPAEKSGLMPKDVVLKVDHKSIKGKAFEEVVNSIRGEKGTDVTLTIKRGGETKDITITRDEIHVDSVTYEKKGKVGVFTINKFQEDTSKELKLAIKKAHKQGVRDIVLDLRNNPGGLLDEAVKMSNIFIEKNKTVVKLQKGNQKEAVKTTIDPLKEAKDMNVSILVNKGSASASEVFTGAMKDYGLAKVYGETTFGKGIVQTTHEFKDGSLLKFTEMKWLTPKEHYIHKKGIKPDVNIKSPRYQSLDLIPDDKTFKVGDKGKNVKSIKIGLEALGYYKGDDKPVFDKDLEQAIMTFQQDEKIELTGTFDKETNERFTEKLVEKANKHDAVLDQLLKQVKSKE
ncbi:S41 family peptidase [Staphylococcus massiliensis]